jgi:hypothetical protein
LGAQGGLMKRGETGDAGEEISQRCVRHVEVQRAAAEAAG